MCEETDVRWSVIFNDIMMVVANILLQHWCYQRDKKSDIGFINMTSHHDVNAEADLEDSCYVLSVPAEL